MWAKVLCIWGAAESGHKRQKFTRGNKRGTESAMAENSEELVRAPHLEWTEAFQKLIKDTHLKHLTVGWVGPPRNPSI